MLKHLIPFYLFFRTVKELQCPQCREVVRDNQVSVFKVVCVNLITVLILFGEISKNSSIENLCIYLFI